MDYTQKVMKLVENEPLAGLRVALVHGFNVKDKGAGTVDQLAPVLRLAGAHVAEDEADYGYFNLLSVRMVDGERRRRILHRLANEFEICDVIITHSNGANFTDLALRMLETGIRKKHIVCHISAALNSKLEPALSVAHELNLVTPHDGWVKLSSYLLFHRWGRRGAIGYRGNSDIVTNRTRKEVKGHSDWFKFEHLFMTLYEIITFIREKRE